VLDTGRQNGDSFSWQLLSCARDNKIIGSKQQKTQAFLELGQFKTRRLETNYIILVCSKSSFTLYMLLMHKRNTFQTLPIDDMATVCHWLMS